MDRGKAKGTTADRITLSEAKTYEVALKAWRGDQGNKKLYGCI